MLPQDGGDWSLCLPGDRVIQLDSHVRPFAIPSTDLETALLLNNCVQCMQVQGPLFHVRYL